jgi:hypothetical protein
MKFELLNCLSILSLALNLLACASPKKVNSNLLLTQTTKAIVTDDQAEDTRNISNGTLIRDQNREAIYSEELQNYPSQWTDAAAEKHGFRKIEYLHYIAKGHEYFDDLVMKFTGDGFLAEQILRENPFLKGRDLLNAGDHLRIPMTLFRPSYSHMNLKFLRKYTEPINRYYRSLIDRGDLEEKYYVVKSNDTYNTIAQKVLNSKHRWKEIYMFNIEHIKKYKGLRSGEKIKYLSPKTQKLKPKPAVKKSAPKFTSL